MALLLVVVCSCVPATANAADVRIGPNRELVVDGKPFFPLFMWLQPVRLIPFHKGLGINTIMGEGASEETAQEFLDALGAEGMFGVVNFNDANAAMKDHPALLAWMYRDEPDLAGQTPFQPPKMQGSTVLIEAEKPDESTFPAGSWLVTEHKQLSGGGWLTASLDELPREPLAARYTVKIPQTGTYVLWDRGMMKEYTSPTRWRFDDEPWQTTPRDLHGSEQRAIGQNQSANWHRYGEVKLTAGEHRFEIRVQDGRTLGAPDQIGNDILFGVDLFLLTTSNETPTTPFEIVPQITPEEIGKIYRDKQKADVTHPICLNLTCGFFGPYRDGAPGGGRYYPAYAAETDILSYDHYPIQGWNRPDWVPQIAAATAALRELAGQKPVWAILETTNGSQWTPDDARAPYPYEIRAEVWMAIVNGATGIGYFPHVWKPKYEQCRIPEENQEELKRINAQITRLAPVILGPDAPTKVACDAAPDSVQFIAREHEGGLYVFAVSLKREPVKARFAVMGLPAGQAVEVLDEGRQVVSSDGWFEDEFGELAVHLYRTKA
jgi:hypothetical protein